MVLGPTKKKPTRRGKKGRKIGRNKLKCETYRRLGRKEANKARRQAKEQKRQEKFKLRRELNAN